MIGSMGLEPRELSIQLPEAFHYSAFDKRPSDAICADTVHVVKEKRSAKTQRKTVCCGAQVSDTTDTFPAKAPALRSTPRYLPISKAFWPLLLNSLATHYSLSAGRKIHAIREELRRVKATTDQPIKHLSKSIQLIVISTVSILSRCNEARQNGEVHSAQLS